MTTVGVIIPSFQRLQQLPPLISTYLALAADEVIVVLDGPHSDADQLRREFHDVRLTILELAENRGLALARIAGLEIAKSDVIMMVDDDVMPSLDTVALHRRHHAKGQSLVVVGYMPVKLFGKRGTDQAATRLYAKEYEQATRVWEATPEVILSGLWNGNVSLPRSLYLEAEALKPSVRLEYNEDLDLGLRLQALGASAIFDRKIRADHSHARSFDGFIKESSARGKSAADVEDRWGLLPAQLLDLVSPGKKSVRMVTNIFRFVPSPVVEAVSRRLYRLLGYTGAFGLQDVLARLMRRILAGRAYESQKGSLHAAKNHSWKGETTA